MGDRRKGVSVSNKREADYTNPRIELQCRCGACGGARRVTLAALRIDEPKISFAPDLNNERDLSTRLRGTRRIILTREEIRIARGDGAEAEALVERVGPRVAFIDNDGDEAGVERAGALERALQE